MATANITLAGAAHLSTPPSPLTAQLLASYTSSPPCNLSNSRSGFTTVNQVFPTTSPGPNSTTGILPPPSTQPASFYSVPPAASPVPNPTSRPEPPFTHHPSPTTDPAPSPPSNPATQPQPSYASKAKPSPARTLRRLSPQTFSPEGGPRVIIPDEVYQQGAALHKDFLVCRFFGRMPAYSLIQNVLNYLWGKGKYLEVHMLPQSNSVLVRLPNDFIREKVLLKRYWYVDTSMFYVFQRSEHQEDFTPSLQKIQLWAHLKGVPFDLMYDADLSHIAGQIREPKETDDWTLNLSSISVAHVKVEIDTTIPLPTKVEVGRSNGTFVTVDVEFPWIPPSCAHCKEVGHIQRHCPHLPPPPTQTPKHRPPIKEPNKTPRNPAPSNKFCFSCRATGHLMNNCPKGPQDWILVNRKNHPPTTSTPSPNTSDPPPYPPPSTSHSLNLQPAIPPFPSSATIDVINSDQPSMEIDTSPQPKALVSDPLVLDTAPNLDPILALPAVFKDRSIIISSSPLPPLTSTLSLNPFAAISPHLATPQPSSQPQTFLPSSSTEPSPSEKSQPLA